MSVSRPFLPVLGVLLVAVSASGQTLVNVCDTDTHAVAGRTNLATALATGGIVRFDCGPSTIIRVTQAYVIARNTVVDGPGIVLDRGGGYGLFAGASESVRLELSGLSLRNGRRLRSRIGSTGGTLVSGNMALILRNVRIETSEDPVATNGGVMEIYDSSFTDNTGVAISGRWIRIWHTSFQNPQADPVMLFGFANTNSFLSIDWNSTFSSGGPVRAIHGLGGSCRVEISRSAFANNHGTPMVRTPGNQGGALWSNCETLIDHTTFTGNRAASGGAVFLTKDVAKAELRRVEFTDNTASATGGALALEPSVTPRTLRLRYCTFARNTARDGGAIDLGSAIENSASLEAAAVLFTANTAQRAGGAIYGENASASIIQGIFNGNSASQRGGAIAMDAYAQRNLLLGNNLLVANRAPFGSALSAAAASLINVTLAANAGPLFAAFRSMPAAPWKGIRVRNTILSAAAAAPACSNQPIQDQGNNLQWPLADCGASIPVADPRLDPLYLPLAGSAALNHGNAAACAAAPINNLDVFAQRRPQNASCTIGAVEYHIEHLPYLNHREERQNRSPGGHR